MDVLENLPLALTDLVVTGLVTYMIVGGTILTSVTLGWTNPVDTKRAYVEVAYYRIGETPPAQLRGIAMLNDTPYLIADQVVTGTVSSIHDLVPGSTYNFLVRGVSYTGHFGKAKTVTLTLPHS